MRRTPTCLLLALACSGFGLSLCEAAPSAVRSGFGRHGAIAPPHGGAPHANRPRSDRRATGFADYDWDRYGYGYRGFGGGPYPLDGYGDPASFDRGRGYASPYGLYPTVLDLPAIPGIRNEPPAPPTIYVLNAREAAGPARGAQASRRRPNARIISLGRSSEPLSGPGASDPDESYEPGGAHIIRINVPRGR
jgi:hypothetical protein